MRLVAGLLRPRLSSSKLSKLKAAEKISGSAIAHNYGLDLSLSKLSIAESSRKFCERHTVVHFLFIQERRE